VIEVGSRRVKPVQRTNRKGKEMSYKQMIRCDICDGEIISNSSHISASDLVDGAEREGYYSVDFNIGNMGITPRITPKSAKAWRIAIANGRAPDCDGNGGISVDICPTCSTLMFQRILRDRPSVFVRAFVEIRNEESANIAIPDSELVELKELDL